MSDTDPRVVQGKRVLGVVPGQPAVGERKVPEDQDLVMVFPHLLVRHAVVALGVLLLVLIVSILFERKRISTENLRARTFSTR